MRRSAQSHRYQVALSLLASLLISTPTAWAQTFTTIINVPPDVTISHLVSHTQLNLLDGGVISTLINAGDPIVSSTDIQVNISGGGMTSGPKAYSGSTININGGSVGDGLEAFWESTVNINGGSVGDNFQAHPGSTIRMTGGTVGDLFDLNTAIPMTVSGGTIGDHFDVLPGSRIDVTGGTFGDQFKVHDNGLAVISGGTFGDRFGLRAGATVVMSGGAFGDRIGTASGSILRLIGGEFLLDGQAIPGLGSGSPVIGVNLPPTSILTGRLLDGSVFVLGSHDGDGIVDGTLQLAPFALPPRPGVINAPLDPVPKGLTSGQTLNLSDGAELGRNFAAVGATLNIAGGVIGSNFEVVDSSVSITGGSVGEGMDVFSGSTVNITDGVVGDRLSALDGGTVNISGGTVGNNAAAHLGGTVNITGGSVGLVFLAKYGSTVNISGGSVGVFFTAEAGSVVNISGGEIGSLLFARAGSEVNLVGTSFILGGVDLTPSLTPGVPFTITDRDTFLLGLFPDGSPINFDLRSENILPEFFSTSATLTVTLVPEPGTAGVLMLGCVAGALKRKRDDASRV